jgi:uncharacterized protein (TIGR00375 family)
MELNTMAIWAKRKGLDLIATGDWTHPLWLREIKNSLEEVETGIYQVKGGPSEVRFILSCEIACIYSQNGKGRRIHLLVLAPSVLTVEKINQELLRRGVRLMSDGRPITGMSARDLVGLVWSVDPECLVIPAHIWTPWFSLYGANSGFDSMQECFGEYAEQIKAVETGLSSDPLMNWRIKELDNRTILSFSDSHSPAKMGREATAIITKDIRYNYQTIKEAIINNQINYTVEFYPEEGKYHFTGHRGCNISRSPEETSKLGNTCPVCGRSMTIGVLHRVEQLGRPEKEVAVKKENDEFGVRWMMGDKRPKYVSLVPLLEIIAESANSTITSQKVINEYNKLTDIYGSEMKVLLNVKAQDLAKLTSPTVVEGITRVRAGKIKVVPGYDGEFGKVKIWEEGQEEAEEDQMSLFEN